MLIKMRTFLRNQFFILKKREKFNIYSVLFKFQSAKRTTVHTRTQVPKNIRQCTFIRILRVSVNPLYMITINVIFIIDSIIGERTINGKGQ